MTASASVGITTPGGHGPPIQGSGAGIKEGGAAADITWVRPGSRLRLRRPALVEGATALGDDLVERSRGSAGEGLTDGGRRAALALGAAFLVGVAAFEVFHTSERAFDLRLVLVLVATYALASRVEFEIGGGSAVPTQVAFVPMLVLLPVDRVPLLVACALALGSLVDVARGDWHPQRLVSVFASSTYALGPAAVLAAAGEPAPGWSALPVYAIALAAQFGADLAAVLVHERLRYGVKPSLQLRLMGEVYVVDLALTPLGALAVGARDEAAWAPLALIPLFGLLRWFARERRARIDNALELGRAYRGTALLLGDVVEADDEYTGSHSREVVELVLAVADRLGLDPVERREAEFAALLHDVGKIRVPAAIVNKPGPLDPAEWAIMKRHTIEGEAMLQKVGGLLGDVGAIVRSCHERWDGKGYPDGLLADETPLTARIVACCDAYNAMTTDRPYRAALPEGAAVAELRANAGTQFDPVVVKALLDVLAATEPRPALGHAA